MSHPIGFNIKAATAARRERRPGGGPEHSEGIAVSPKELKRGAFYATRFRRIFSLNLDARNSKKHTQTCLVAAIGSMALSVS